MKPISELPIHPAFIGSAADQATPQVTPQVRALLKTAMTSCTREQLQAVSGIRDREHFRKQYLAPLLEAKLLEMTIPDKPRSSLQQYRTIPAGRAALVIRKTKS